MEIVDFSKPIRQSPKGIIIIFALNASKFIRRFFVIFIAFGLSLAKKKSFAFLSTNLLLLIIASVLISILILAILKYLNFKFHLTNDEFYFDSQGNKLSTPRVTDEGLERGQKFYRKNKEVSLLVLLGIYALNIIDANVDAHLMQYNVDENLSLAPHFKINEVDATSNLGLTLNFNF